jgi:hypothetical protein
MRVIHRLLDAGALAAALVGALAMVRADWETAGAALALLIVTSAAAAFWME